jgi:hypothetical protein
MTMAAPSSTAPPNSQYVGSYTDPGSGRAFDRYLTQESIPITQWKQEEVTERRWVPEWVTENQKVTQTQYTPYVQYLPQARVVNSWNVFAQPQVAWYYQPVTQYQPVQQLVDQPVTYQKYVEKDFRMVIPKAVQTTQAQQRYVDVERTVNPATPSAIPSTAPVNNPMSNAASLAVTDRNTLTPGYDTRPASPYYAANTQSLGAYPYSPFAYTSANRAPSFNLAASYPMPYAAAAYPGYPSAANPYAYPMTTAPPMYSFSSYPMAGSSAAMPGYPGYPTGYQTASAYLPAWMNTQGPLLGQTYFQYNPSQLATSDAPPSTTPYPTTNTLAMTTPSPVSSELRPSTAPVYPQANPGWDATAMQSTYRDPYQAGIPATVLR